MEFSYKVSEGICRGLEAEAKGRLALRDTQNGDVLGFHPCLSGAALVGGESEFPNGACG